MSKATLEFNLPEEINEFTLANKGGDYFCCLWDIDQKLREVMKYGHDYKTVEDFAESLRNIISDSVDLDEVA